MWVLPEDHTFQDVLALHKEIEAEVNTLVENYQQAKLAAEEAAALAKSTALALDIARRDLNSTLAAASNRGFRVAINQVQ